MAEQAVGKEMLWKECMIKDFLWIGLFCLTATTYFVFRVVKWMISQQKEKGVAPRSGIQGCVEEPSTPGKEAKSTRNRPKRPSQDLSKWMKTLSKDLIKKKTRRGDLIPPSQHPGCTVYWRPPLYVTKKKENAPRCQQQKRWGVPQHEMKKAKEYVNQRKNAVCAQKPLLGQELLRRNALKELFQRKEDISAPKIWIAPELEKKWAKEEASRRQKAIDAEIQERERQERLVRPNNQGQKALQEFDFLEESDVLGFHSWPQRSPQGLRSRQEAQVLRGRHQTKTQTPLHSSSPPSNHGSSGSWADYQPWRSAWLETDKP
ncbi:uncharacterized protein LOC143828610 isoform X5 [Paroedura picta]|uniref:uncharacterized protein LOC143828610 isoform X5 n=1 Tax=Paroedura picta TaxID=143630 RepID=UPI004056F2BC